MVTWRNVAMERVSWCQVAIERVSWHQVAMERVSWHLVTMEKVYWCLVVKAKKRDCHDHRLTYPKGVHSYRDRTHICMRGQEKNRWLCINRWQRVWCTHWLEEVPVWLYAFWVCKHVWYVKVVFLLNNISDVHTLLISPQYKSFEWSSHWYKNNYAWDKIILYQ